MKPIIYICLLSLLFSLGCERGKREKRGERFCPSANLSTEQKNFISQVRKDFKQKNKDLSEEQKPEEQKPEEQKKAQRDQRNQKILNETPSLTNEQKQALSSCFEQRSR